MKNPVRGLLSLFLVFALVTALFTDGAGLPGGVAAAEKTAGFLTAEALKKAAPTEVVVKLAAEKPVTDGLRIETGETAGDQFARQQDLNLASQVPQENLVVVETTGQDATAVAAELEQQAEVEWAEPNHVVYADAAPHEITGNIDTGNGFGTDAPRVWPTATGEGVVVAVLDTGFDLQHTDLKDNLWLNSDEICGNEQDDDNNGFIDDCHGWDFVGSNYKQAKADNDPDDPHGHGTHVAGIVAAADNELGVVGVAPKVRLMPIKVLDDQPIPGGTLAGIIGGLRYAIDNGADIINMSFGGGAPLGEGVESLINEATAKGIILVGSAGNAQGQVAANYPASYPPVIAVGASTMAGKVAAFSSRGYTDFVAPGTWQGADTKEIGIFSTYPGDLYEYSEGTSMAAPHITGAVALYLQANPNATPAMVEAALQQTALDIETPGFDNAAGHGLINAARLVLPPILQAAETTITVAGKPEIAFGFFASEAGTMQVGDGCGTLSILEVQSGENRLELIDLKEQAYENCTLTVTDSQGQKSGPLLLPKFEIDLTAPIVTLLSPASGAVVEGTGSFTFAANEATVSSECSINGIEWRVCESGSTFFHDLPGWQVPDVVSTPPVPTPPENPTMAITPMPSDPSDAATPPLIMPTPATKLVPIRLRIAVVDRAGHRGEATLEVMAIGGSEPPLQTPPPTATANPTAAVSPSATAIASATTTPKPSPTASATISVSPSPSVSPAQTAVIAPSPAAGGTGGGGGTSAGATAKAPADTPVCRSPLLSAYQPRKEARIAAFDRISFIADDTAEPASMTISLNGKRLTVTVTEQSDNTWLATATVPRSTIKNGANQIVVAAAAKRKCNGNARSTSYTVIIDPASSPVPTPVITPSQPPVINETRIMPTPFALPEPVTSTARERSPLVSTDTSRTKSESGKLFSAETSFPDLVGHWAQRFVLPLANLGVINGYGNDRFGPDNLLTRAEAVKIGLKAFAYEVPERITASTFHDVERDAWYAVFIEAAAKNDIINGLGDGRFAPDAPVTRAEALKILTKAAKADISATGGGGDFADVGADEWFAPFVTWAVANTVVNGFADGSFQPHTAVTRAEFAKMTSLMMPRTGY